VANDGVDNYGQLWTGIDKTIGYVLASQIIGYVVFYALSHFPPD